MGAAGCADPAVVLRFTSSRPKGELSALCVALDADGATRFSQLYPLDQMDLPQSLTVLAGPRKAMQVLAYGFRGGIERVRRRQRVPFQAGAIGEKEISLDPGPLATPPISWQLTGEQTAQVERAALIPLGEGGVVVTLSKGGSRYEASNAGLRPLLGGAPVSQAQWGPVRDLVAVDVDGDCDQDLVIAADEVSPVLWLRSADGQYTDESARLGSPSSARAIAAGDLDGDHAVDLVMAGGAVVEVQHNDRSGNFSEVLGAVLAAELPTDATALALGDLDDDQKLDLVVGQGPGATEGVRVYQGSGSGFRWVPDALPAPVGAVSALAMGDLNHDGRDDLVVAERGGPVRLFLAGIDGHLDDASAGVPDASTGEVTSLLLADLDGNGLPDLVVSRIGELPRIWLNQGGGQLAMGSPPDLAAPATGALAEDVDGDGYLDLVFYGEQLGLVLNLQRGGLTR